MSLLKGTHLVSIPKGTHNLRIPKGVHFLDILLRLILFTTLFSKLFTKLFKCSASEAKTLFYIEHLLFMIRKFIAPIESNPLDLLKK